ncbi:AAA family ATPase [Kitasatospora sp. NPDC092948]|uniref:AAA family ATPase n=1 Tax=Kitasatospora sp. NPDC092948 TaxID=3364088 RepID=UPI0038111CF2
MRRSKPVVHLLSGLPGAGKTTYAKELERHGVVRLSVDERMTARHGRLGTDYPEAEHLALLGEVVAQVRAELAELVRAGRSVVLDHGLGTRAERDAYKRLVVGLGARWRLWHFPAQQPELLRRLAVREERGEGVRLSAAALAWIAARSEEPCGEGEEPTPGQWPPCGRAQPPSR